MGWKNTKDRFLKNVEKEGKKFFQNILNEDIQITETVAPLLFEKIEIPHIQNSTESKEEDLNLIQFKNLNLEKKPVGRGAYGVVLFGDLFNTFPIAAKKIYKFDFEESGLKEMKFLKSVDSKNVIKCLGYSETDDFLFVILERMNCNLFQFLNVNRNLNLKKKIEIIFEIAQGLIILHQQKIIHLDVKPSNILLNGDGSIVKIADFGISKLKTTNDTSFTKNTNLGTLGYQAPELFVNGDFGPHSDIYSLGIMMFEIVFQTSPYTNEELSDDDFKKSVRKGKRPNLEQFDFLKDEKLTMLIDLMKQCWDLKKNQRPTAAEIIESLNSIYKLKIK
jgi:serine/threonine protein kinase